MAKNEPIVFEDAEGNEISNDPRWHAQKLLDQADERRKALEAGDDEDVPTDDLDGLKGADLKKVAEDEEVDISGLKKVGEVKDAIRQARLAKQHTPPAGS